jgi:prepilin-type processing-associated H-X9-DG protein
VYADDYQDGIVPATGGVTVGSPSITNSWCAGTMTIAQEANNTDLIKQSLLYRYVGNVAVYKDPGDRSQNVRSYSENCAMNCYTTDSQPTPVIIFKKTTSVPRPTQFFTFIDENSDLIDNSHFLVRFDKNYDTASVEDQPANYHINSGNLAYVDGHVAAKKWNAKPVDDMDPDGIWLMQHGSLPLDGMGWPAPIMP